MIDNIDTSLLAELSEEEREVAIKILKQYAEAGISETFTALQNADFEEVPVDIFIVRILLNKKFQHLLI